MVAMNLDDLPEVLTTTEIARLERVTIRCVQKWRTQGVYRGGHRVFLNARFAGTRLRVSREAYIEFIKACNLDTWREAAEQQKR